LLEKLQTGTAEELEEIAGKLQIDGPVLEFVAFQILKPYAEKLAETLPTSPEGAKWVKGYCPVCGSWPEIGFVDGKEGARSLRCSFCGHQWRFMRTQCPFCETTDPEKLEMYYAEDRPSERAELCHECNRYLVSVDLRDRVEETVPEIAPLGLVHLDILAQERGFFPGAVCAWNLISG
jgi:FdhE protein